MLEYDPGALAAREAEGGVASLLGLARVYDNRVWRTRPRMSTSTLVPLLHTRLKAPSRRR